MDISAPVKLSLNRTLSPELFVSAADLRTVYCCGDLAIAPENRTCDLVSAKDGTFLFLTKAQNMVLWNGSGTHFSGTVNGVRFSVPANSLIKVPVPERLPRGSKKEFFQDFFLNEEPLTVTDTAVPY